MQKPTIDSLAVAPSFGTFPCGSSTPCVLKNIPENSVFESMCQSRILAFLFLYRA